MLSVLTKKRGGEHKETFGGDEYVYYLDCGDNAMGECICSKPLNCIH